jgi:hypothetical protein
LSNRGKETANKSMAQRDGGRARGIKREAWEATNGSALPHLHLASKHNEEVDPFVNTDFVPASCHATFPAAPG